MIDLGPPPLWVPPKPAIIRPWLEKPIRAGVFGSQIFQSPVLAGKQGGSTSFSLQSSGTGTGTTITIPSSAAGDLCVIFNFVGGASAADAKTPSGFTAITPDPMVAGENTVFDGVTRFTYSISYKKLVGGETTVTGANGVSAHTYWIVMVFRPVGSFSTVTVNGLSKQATGSNPTNQAPAAASGTPPVIVLGMMGSGNDGANNSVSPRSTTPAMSELNQTTFFYAHYLIYNTAPANQTTYDMDDEGSGNCLCSFYLTFT